MIAIVHDVRNSTASWVWKLTGGVVADVGCWAGAGLVVGEDSGEVGVAAHAEEWACGFSGVAGVLHPIVPLDESRVVLHQWHLVPHYRAVACAGLRHPDVLWRTWICWRKGEEELTMVITCWRKSGTFWEICSVAFLLRWLIPLSHL